MVKHQPLQQVYEKQLCLSFLTGIYGCRWKRYQRSHDNSSKWECAWFIILCSTFSLLLFWAYFWLEAHNDYNQFNWLLYNRSGEWKDGTVPILATTAVGFSYITFLMVLALCHISLGQQLNLYWIHKIGVLAALITTVSGVVSISDVWGDEWDIILISLQFTGPFLHIGALAAVTALGWLVAGHVIRAGRTSNVLLVLYMVPLAITSPCIMDRNSLKPRPDVIGRRGAPMNLFILFMKASVVPTVLYSLDGVPFLMRDRTLRRTTNIAKVFPDKQHEDASLFNWTEIRSLNAGQWFLESDPYWTVGSLTGRERNRMGNLTVCSLVEMLRLTARANRSALLNLQRPPPEHPHYKTWIMDTLWAVQRSGISQKRVTWTPDTDRGRVRGLQQTSLEKLSGEEVRHRGISSLTLRYSQASNKDIQDFLVNNMSVMVYPVNEPWLYSVLWCSGVPSVSSDAPQVLRKVPYPIWLMSPYEYCLVWITSDLVSIAIVTGIFIFQKWRMSGMQNYNPEQIMLSAVTRRPSRDVNIMKEKLIFSEVSNGVTNTDEHLYPENGYDIGQYK
uniref:Glycerophosphodiester phosphodiesterase domain containing 5a n=1 Tax=Oncorhynchus mykiss TaxID=8022 RepID=A0A8C7RSP4_ONCMY